MLTLVIALNNSPAMWEMLPLPADAMLSFPGLAIAKAINSGTVFPGTDGWVTMTRGSRLILATGAMSRMKLKLSLSYSVALIAFAH
jgi:hypothetical protein